jgi:hypothetical protein
MVIIDDDLVNIILLISLSSVYCTHLELDFVNDWVWGLGDPVLHEE